MKKLIVVVAVVWAAPASAQTPAPGAPPAAVPPASGVTITGSLTPGIQQVENTANSSKLEEYRSLRDAFYLPSLRVSMNNAQTGWFFDVKGVDVVRDDQTIVAEAGRPGTWRINANWVGIPHNFSYKAVTPYIRRAPGLFEVPATVPITFKKLATAAADAPGVLASDELVAAYQRAFLQPTPLSTQTNTGQFSVAWAGSDGLSLDIAYDRRAKTGLKVGYGPIGDRPPRTLNIQLTEPVDYRTNDVTFAAEHQGRGYVVRGEYLLSDFANRIETLQWQNVFATPAAGATFDVWDRSVSAYGVRPLPPDNRLHNVSAAFGGDLPLDSRITASVGYGRLEQNETLLPYSFNNDRLAVRTLPRSTAEGLINTVSFNADYVIAPVRRLNLRAFYRRYDLNNETPSSRWQYVTQDTNNLNGTVSYLNKRVSLPYAWERDNAGAEATWRLPARSSFTIAYEREAIAREHREADTSENVFRAAWRTRARSWLSLQSRYVESRRDGGEYNNAVTNEGYWYALSEANDNNNPLLTFDNHPDMRRYDVSDRRRRQFDLRVNLTPQDVVSLAAFVRYRNDDYESDVTATQPLLGTSLADAAARTPGDQLGRLEDTRTRYGVDLFVEPTSRVMFNAFVNYDLGTSLDRSMEFQENNKANPSVVATAELGPWTRASSQWTAEFDDRTWSGGVGTTLHVVPGKLLLSGDYTASLASIDTTYGGFGVTNFDGTPFSSTHQFGFSSPPTVREDLHVLNLRVEIPFGMMTLLAGYGYENYTLIDWQQAPAAPWVEAVGADTLLRDTSRSHQWGNRLFNLGTYLAPSYDAHIGFVGVRYRF
jgi:MtrB/PioB family decaheme-associated outer membrane protein